MTRFGHHFLSVPDKAAVANHLIKIQAAGSLFYQTEQDFARQIKRALPASHIVIRSYPDKDNVKNFPNVDDWINRNGSLGDGGLIVQTTNEIAWSPDNIDWHFRLLTRIKERNLGLRVGMFAIATGNPIDVNSWYLGEKLFRLVATMRDQAFMLLHEYFGGVITSGMIGGNPDHAGVPVGQPGGLNLIPMENWPKDTSNLTLFHVGRHRFLLNYLKSKNIPAPSILISVFGADYLGDIGAWLATLTSDSARKDYPDTVDGWRELITQWGEFYPGISAPDVNMAMWGYGDQHMISPEVEAIFPYMFGVDLNWMKYRNDPDMIDPLERYAASSPQQPPTIPVVPTYPKLPEPTDPRWNKVKAIPKNGNVNVRDVPDKAGNIVAGIHADDELYVVSSEAAGIWMPVKLINDELLRGWVSTDVISFQDVPATQPPTEPSPTIALSRAELQELQWLHQGLADKYAEYLKR